MKIEKLVLFLVLLPLIAFFFLILLPLILLYGALMVLLHRPIQFRTVGRGFFSGEGKSSSGSDDVIDVEVIHSENSSGCEDASGRALRQ